MKFSSPLFPAADDLWSMSDIYCNNLPMVTMLVPTPRKTPAVNTETGLVREPDAVDLLPIDENVKRYSIGQQFTKPANITNAQYQLFVSRPVLGLFFRTSDSSSKIYIRTVSVPVLVPHMNLIGNSVLLLNLDQAPIQFISTPSGTDDRLNSSSSHLFSKT